MKKRVLSLALALVMVLSLVPISAGAVNSYGDEQGLIKMLEKKGYM